MSNLRWRPLGSRGIWKGEGSALKHSFSLKPWEEAVCLDGDSRFSPSSSLLPSTGALPSLLVKSRRLLRFRSEVKLLSPAQTHHVRSSSHLPTTFAPRLGVCSSQRRRSYAPCMPVGKEGQRVPRVLDLLTNVKGDGGDGTRPTELPCLFAAS